ncbi:hypothetical protein GOP47_0009177 [Adiantum capillus-veneris]|uniref:Pentatricopeptide repeat-containing protein n=1 Tax=Adiantum capillus-veneris TaxID=13818 RepID=A0A9D4ZJA4_ADICA|nr:hypothetical protein GOP47_0009177 [Adiantum capillus-veneris]
MILQGQEYFKMMIEEFGILPASDHFSCMVDLFARSGSLIEAQKFLEALPCFPSRDIWIPLLSACKTHAEVDIGHKCFEQLLHTDPDCASSYVLMLNLYASVEQWNEVAKTEELEKKHRQKEEILDTGAVQQKTLRGRTAALVNGSSLTQAQMHQVAHLASFSIFSIYHTSSDSPGTPSTSPHMLVSFVLANTPHIQIGVPPITSSTSSYLL